MFMIGGFSGLHHAAPPGDAQQQDTYYVVAHFHYVLIGGSIFALFGGIYYWFPKITGRMTKDTLGTLAFILLFIGFNVTFFPMHWLGLDGMPRRIYTYAPDMGWNYWNMVCTVGAFIMLTAFIVIFIDLRLAMRHGAKAGNDPWDGRTLEWTLPSPPPEYNFDVIPTISDRDEFWRKKHPRLHRLTADNASQSRTHDGGASDTASHSNTADTNSHSYHDAHGIHMPDASWFPLFAAVGFFFGAYGLLYKFYPLAIGGLLFGIFCIYNWALEGPGGYEIHPDGKGAASA